MSGYFYNDGKVVDGGTVSQALERVGAGPQLILFGPSEWNHAARSSDFAFLKLAEGPRGNVLVRVSRSTAP